MIEVLVYDDLLGLMKPGALLAFSLNDLSLEDPDYSRLVPDSVEAGKVKVLSEEHGPHLAKYGDNSGVTFGAPRVRCLLCIA